jgi:hypothetical protein
MCCYCLHFRRCLGPIANTFVIIDEIIENAVADFDIIENVVVDSDCIANDTPLHNIVGITDTMSADTIMMDVHVDNNFATCDTPVYKRKNDQAPIDVKKS